MELKYGTWKISSYEPADARALCAAGFSPITAALLCSRGYRDAGAAREFLSCSYPLSSPFALLDMDKAAARVKQALSRREHIAVFGDYDVDGITATCLLTEYLRSKGGHVTSYIPARLEEGYGLNPIAIDTLKKQGVELIVTVDCGITANHEAALCRELGIDLVITDHHECKSELPQAIALVDPHRKDQPQPVTEMAGVGVAFKLAAAIEGEQETLLDQYCDFLCLGTVADVMPLTGENRTMVARGLKALENPRRVGIAALMAECSVQKGPVTAGTIGYTLAPRINAAGRMGEVGIATELFLTHDAGRAVELAGALCRLNRRRQEIESSIYQSAVAMLPPGGRRRRSCWRTRAGTRALSASWPPAWRRNTAARRSSSASTATRARPRRGPTAGSTCSGRWSSCPACLKATAGMSLPPDLPSGARASRPSGKR